MSYYSKWSCLIEIKKDKKNRFFSKKNLRKNIDCVLTHFSVFSRMIFII